MSASDWIVATGVRAVDDDADSTLIPDAVMQDPNLSLEAKGLYAVLLAERSAAVNPYDDALDDPTPIAPVIEELLSAGLAVRVPRPPDQREEAPPRPDET